MYLLAEVFFYAKNKYFNNINTLNYKIFNNE